MRMPGRAQGAEFGPPHQARPQHPGLVLGGTVAPRQIPNRIRHRILLLLRKLRPTMDSV